MEKKHGDKGKDHQKIAPEGDHFKGKGVGQDLERRPACTPKEHRKDEEVAEMFWLHCGSLQVGCEIVTGLYLFSGAMEYGIYKATL